MKPHIATSPVLPANMLNAVLAKLPPQLCGICGEHKSCLRDTRNNKPICLSCSEWISNGKGKKGKR